ncbi:hypothetical protein VP01_2088g3 [Puccinia sorghi]|uniref:Uncharacterized protein n=1 Tax=Puccinia sorghi TaxID=27349 RepID=A0A0L6VAI6_9BASI|nr:hypothetical protein VP01_2088g3 [Puccinia sorghi]
MCETIMTTLQEHLPALGIEVCSNDLAGDLFWEGFIADHPLYSRETQYYIYSKQFWAQFAKPFDQGKCVRSEEYKEVFWS